MSWLGFRDGHRLVRNAALYGQGFATARSEQPRAGVVLSNICLPTGASQGSPELSDV
jgi:hypothetical protein